MHLLREVDARTIDVKDTNASARLIRLFWQTPLKNNASLECNVLSLLAGPANSLNNGSASS